MEHSFEVAGAHFQAGDEFQRTAFGAGTSRGEPIVITRSFRRIATVVAALALVVPVSVALTQGTASASSIVTQTGVYSYCSLLPANGGDCLVYPVAASGIGPQVVSGPAISATFAGYYYNGSRWVEGQAGRVWVPWYSQGTLLTGVVHGTQEQVTSFGLTDSFTLIF